MKCAILVNNAAHQTQHAAWMKAGLERHGWTVQMQSRVAPIARVDMACSWSVKHRGVWDWQKREGGPVLVMERAALQPRMIFTGCGFDGLAGRGRYPKAPDGGARWRQHFAQLERPWREGGDYALLCGQVRGDAALWGVNFPSWAQRVTSDLAARGIAVRYRPHPFSLKSNDRFCPTGAVFSTRPYDEDLAGARFVVTFNSTAGVEAVLAGVPAVTFDQGAMAWPMTTHSLDDALIRPDRTAWTHDLAWSCWRPEEIERGDAWDALRGISGLPGTSPPSPDIGMPISAAPRPRRCLVLGGADCVWADMNTALDIADFDGVIACNDAIAHYPGRLVAAATLHPGKIDRWLSARAARGFPPVELVYAHRKDPKATAVNRHTPYQWDGRGKSGSSGLFAVKVAMELGFGRVVLCGVPLHGDRAHFFDRNKWRDAIAFRAAWQAEKGRLEGTVKSMSGWTADLLGRPDSSWLASA